MVKVIDIEEFLYIADNGTVVIDVRSPEEYNHGHIPYAYNIPLFNDEERKVVGTIYKNSGREEAVLKGIEYVSKKMVSLLKDIDNKSNGNKKILMYCARGGMRSESFGWLSSIYGYEVYILRHGYKNYRNYVLFTFTKEYKIILLSGRTGSGKTIILKELDFFKKQVVDLEAIAHHKGSAFGGVGEISQPTQEQFENNFAFRLSKIDITKEIWLEDESLLIGKCAIPKGFFSQMKTPYKIIYLDIPKEIRAKYIAENYGLYDKCQLRDAILKIEKRLGGERTKEAIKLLEENDIYECVLTLLYYYDKSYKLNTKSNTEDIIELKFDTLDAKTISESLLSFKY